MTGTRDVFGAGITGVGPMPCFTERLAGLPHATTARPINTEKTRIRAVIHPLVRVRHPIKGKNQTLMHGLAYFCPVAAAAQAPSIARSASLMPVLLAGGIVRVTNARSRMRAAFDSICSRVSNITPTGAPP